MSSSPGMNSLLIVEENGNGVTIVRFRPEQILEQESIDQIGRELSGLATGRPRILLNLASVKYLASGMLAKFLTMQRRMATTGGKLRVCNIEPQAYEVFKVTRLYTLFDIYADVSSALDGF